MTESTAALELVDVVAGYGQTTVLRGVSISVPQSAVVALLGPNGAGKTTLLRVASGVLGSRSGRVVLGGRDVTGLHVHELTRQRLCHVPEGRGVFPSLSVRENLRLFSPRGRETECIDRAITVFPRLAQRLKQTAGSLSGGEQQMLAIVRAYITDPAVVLVDEASMGLGPIVVEQLFDFLSNLASEGASLLLVEQYVHRALALAQHVYVLSQGRIVLSGAPAELEGQDLFARYLGVEAALPEP